MYNSKEQEAEQQSFRALPEIDLKNGDYNAPPAPPPPPPSTLQAQPLPMGFVEPTAPSAPPPTVGFNGYPHQSEYGNDPEVGHYDNDMKTFGFNEESIRRGFIRKVYCILMVQLLITFGIVSLFVFCEPIKYWAIRNNYMVMVSSLILFVVIVALAAAEELRRQTPINFILLLIVTVVQSFSLGCISSYYDQEAILYALGITAVVCLVLTFFGFQTLSDFTVCGAGLLILMVIFLLFCIISIFLPHGRMLTLVYASMGAILVSFYLLYDTQMMVGKKYEYSLSPEDYIFAALNIYLDLVSMFIYILTIIGETKN